MKFKFLIFFYFFVIFALLDPDPDPKHYDSLTSYSVPIISQIITGVLYEQEEAVTLRLSRLLRVQDRLQLR
jgi:hypothetical protein